MGWGVAVGGSGETVLDGCVVGEADGRVVGVSEGVCTPPVASIKLLAEDVACIDCPGRLYLCRTRLIP